jgi:hypothetical protein
VRNFTLILLAAVSFTSGTSGADTRTVYFDSLKVAQAKLDRQKRPAHGANALSVSLLAQFIGRPYRLGDSWRVAAWIPDPSIMRQTSDPGSLAPKRGRGGIFQYEVTSVRGSEVDLKITQVENTGLPMVDPHVKSLNLTVSFAQGLEQKAKTYTLGESGKIFTASPEGLHMPVSHLELFPLEAPELTTAMRGEVRAVPALPPELQAIARGTSLQIDPAHAARFEQDDFFGRQIEAIWRQGDPWPVYIKTTNGTAILLSGQSAEGSSR